MADNVQQIQLEACRSIGWGENVSLTLSSLDEPTWHNLLRFLDENGLTLPFRRRFPRAALPDWVSQRLDKNFEDNQKRYETIVAQQVELLHAFAEKKIETTLLKGTALARQTYPDPRDRVQYDFDFLVRPDQMRHAEVTLANHGYRRDSLQTPDHVCMAPPQKYTWKGNFFDPRIPLKVELHDRLWHSRYRIAIQGLLAKPETVPADDTGLQAARLLSPLDQFLFLNLHFFRHLFQNQVRLSHLFEIGVLLKCAGSWTAMLERTKESQAMRRILFLNCHLMSQLFDLPLKGIPLADEEFRLPPAVKTWLQREALSDLLSRFSGNKNYVRLQMEFSDAPWRVLGDALQVHRLPPAGRVTYEMQASGAKKFPLQYIVYCLRRIREHIKGYLVLLFRAR